MNINIKADSLMRGGLLSRGNGLKSTQQRMERKQECDNKVAFFEGQKENLKNLKCGSIEEIQQKLELFHSYEEQIAAAKTEYNNEQMWHIMDESTERGEKIAEAAEKLEPKTPEERKEEMVEEALGIEESGGLLEEVMEEVEEIAEELTDDMTEATEMTEELVSEATEASEETASEATEVSEETASEAIEISEETEMSEEVAAEATEMSEEIASAATQMPETAENMAGAAVQTTAESIEDAAEKMFLYKRIDTYI